MLCCRSFSARIMDTKKRSIKISRRKRFVSQMPKSFVGDPLFQKNSGIENFDGKERERDGVS